jgi:hypothetical protein
VQGPLAFQNADILYFLPGHVRDAFGQLLPLFASVTRGRCRVHDKDDPIERVAHVCNPSRRRLLTDWALPDTSPYFDCRKSEECEPAPSSLEDVPGAMSRCNAPTILVPVKQTWSCTFQAETDSVLKTVCPFPP